MIKVYVNNGTGEVDYTAYVVSQSISIQHEINAPAVLSLQMSNNNNAFVLPVQRSYVRVHSSKYNRDIFTGLLSNDPGRSFLGMGNRSKTGGQVFNFTLQFTSDEYLLNIKQVQLIPNFVNQRQGHILRTIAETLCPGYFDFTSCADGDIVPFMAYDPTKTWSDYAKEFCDASRYRYSVINKQIHFQPYGDGFLGIAYDESKPQATFDPYSLQTSAVTTPIVNDVTIIGAQEAGACREDYFIGDGFTGTFPLRHKVFGIASAEQGSSILLNDAWQGTTLNSQNWKAQDPGTNFNYALNGSAALNILTGTPNVAGTSNIIANNAIELAGGLTLQHGEVVFNDVSTGLIGAIFDSSALTAYGQYTLNDTECEAGFKIMPSSIVSVTASGAAGILVQPYRLGAYVPKAFTVTTKVNCSYVLQTQLSTPAASRYNQTFRTMAGIVYGGAAQTQTQGSITWLVVETNLFTGVQTKYTFTLADQVMPTTAIYALIDNVNLNITLTQTVLSSPVPGSLAVGCKIGAGLLAPIYISGTVQYTGGFVTPSGGNLPILPVELGPENTFSLGTSLQGQAAEIDSGQLTDTLNFYGDDLPGVGTRIRLQTWESQAAIARIQVTGSIQQEAAVVGDNGLRSSAVSNLNPLPRTSEDCEFAAQAFLADRSRIYYQGSYKASYYFFHQQYSDIEFFPVPGRFLYVNAPHRGIHKENFVVSTVTTTIEELAGEILSYNITFGPDLTLQKLLPKFVGQPQNVLTPLDTATPPSPQVLETIGTNYLPDIKLTRIVGNIVGSQITISLLDPCPANAHYEIRSQDLNWGYADSRLLAFVGPADSKVVTLPRTSHEQLWYVRLVSGLLPLALSPSKNPFTQHIVPSVAQVGITTTQVGTTTTTTTQVPTPPVVTTIANQERLTDWIQDVAGVGNLYGGSTGSHGSFPFTPGMPGIFSASGASPYDNGYLYRNVGVYANETHFTYHIEVMFPQITDRSACQAFECEVQQNTNSLVANGAFQYDLVRNTYNTFDFGPAKSWVDTGIVPNTADWVPNQYTVIEFDFVRDPIASTVTHTRISINGVNHAVNITRPLISLVDHDYVNVAVQLDCNGTSPTPPAYKVALQNITLSMSNGISGSQTVTTIVSGTQSITTTGAIMQPAVQSATLPLASSGTQINSSRRTKVMRVVYPRVPAAPSFIRANSAELAFDFAGDVRDVEGIELRAGDDTTVYYQAIVGSEFDMALQLDDLRGQLSAAGLSASGNLGTYQVAVVPSGQRNFNAHFFNLMWEYSPGISVYVPPPAAPQVDIGYRFGSTLNLLLNNPISYQYPTPIGPGQIPPPGGFLPPIHPGNPIIVQSYAQQPVSFSGSFGPTAPPAPARTVNAFQPPRTDILVTNIQICSQSFFPEPLTQIQQNLQDQNMLMQTQVSGLPESYTVTVPTSQDLYIRVQCVDHISAGPWSSVLYVPQGNLIASDYLAGQGSIPPSVTNLLGASGGLFTYSSSYDYASGNLFLQIANAQFNIVWPNGNVDSCPASTAIAYGPLDSAIVGQYNLQYSTLYGYFPCVKNPTTTNPSISFNGPYLNYNAVKSFSSQLSDGSVPLTAGGLLAQTAPSGGPPPPPPGGGTYNPPSTGGGGGGTTGGNCGEVHRFVLCTNGEWKMLGALQVGDIVANLAGRKSKVVEIRRFPEQTAIYKTASGLETETALGHVLHHNCQWHPLLDIYDDDLSKMTLWTERDENDTVVSFELTEGKKDICKLQLAPCEPDIATDDDHVYNLDGFWSHNIIYKNAPL